MLSRSRSLNAVRVVSCVLLENSLGRIATTKSKHASPSTSNLQLNINLQRDTVKDPFHLTLRKSTNKEEVYLPLQTLPRYFTKQSPLMHTVFVSAAETHAVRKRDTFLHLVSVNGVVGGAAQMRAIRTLMKEELHLQLQVMVPPALLVPKEVLKAQETAKKGAALKAKREASAREEEEEEGEEEEADDEVETTKPAKKKMKKARPGTSTDLLVSIEREMRMKKDANKNKRTNKNKKRRANDTKKRIARAVAEAAAEEEEEEAELEDEAEAIANSFLAGKKSTRRIKKRKGKAGSKKLKKVKKVKKVLRTKTRPVHDEEVEVEDEDVESIMATFEKKTNKSARASPKAVTRAVHTKEEDDDDDDDAEEDGDDGDDGEETEDKTPWFRRAPKAATKKKTSAPAEEEDEDEDDTDDSEMVELSF